MSKLGRRAPKKVLQSKGLTLDGAHARRGQAKGLQFLGGAQGAGYTAQQLAQLQQRAPMQLQQAYLQQGLQPNA